MNRRSFIAGILAACVAPKILIPKQKDAFKWHVTRRRGLYIAEFRYAVSPPTRGQMEHMLLMVQEPMEGNFIEPARPIFTPHSPGWDGFACLDGQQYEVPEVKGKVKVEYKANPDGTITFGSVLQTEAEQQGPGRWRFCSAAYIDARST